MKETKTIYEKIAETTLINSAKQLEKNAVSLSGFVVHKPTFVNNGKMVAFDITTIHKTTRGISYQHYNCFSNATKVINVFKEMTNVCFVKASGSLRKIKGSCLPMIIKLEPQIESNYLLIEKEMKGYGKKENN